MSSIALFPCLYTPATGLISELATMLKLSVYNDDDIIHDTSKKFNIKSQDLRKMMFGKTSVFNQFTLDREKSVNMFQSVLAEKLNDKDHYFFHGFCTLLIPPQIGHILRTLIVDKRESRIEYALSEGVSERDAARRIKNHDTSAYFWSDFLYQKEAYDRSLYDLIIPFNNRSIQEIADEIIGHYHTTSLLHTSETQNAVQNMQLEAGVRRILLHSGHNINVKADKGKVTLTTGSSIFGNGKFERELKDLVGNIEGVENVKIEQCAKNSLSIYRRQKFELPSKVLFVDDEKDFVQTVSQRLISRDVGTYGVFNGNEALELIEEDRPDVMVLDLKMPGLYGVEVLRRTKKLAPEVEVIILTGHGTTKDMQECMELGAFAYLNKPVNIEELSEAIKAANAKVQSSTLEN